MSEEVLSLPAKSLLVSKLNTRKPTAESVAELAASIQASGQITPVIARPGKKKYTYEIAAGARRATACAAIGIDVQTIVRDIPDDVFEDMILTDNLQREDPDPYQEALLVERRIKSGASIAEIAARYGKPESWVRRRMKLLGIMPELMELVRETMPHFNTTMLELLGALPEHIQQELVDDTYGLEDVKTLSDLKAFVSDRDCKLENVTWLDQPESFVPGCGPGCASSSDFSLFKDEGECAQCLNSACFFARRSLAYDHAITAALAGNVINDVLIFNSKSYYCEREYQGEKLKVIGGYDFNSKYKIVKRPTDAIGLDLEDPFAPKLVHLKIKADTSITTGSTAATTTGDTRVERTRAKRGGHVTAAIIDHLKILSWADIAALHHDPTQKLIHLITAFGSSHRKTWINSGDVEWATLEFDHTCEILWERLRETLRQRLSYSKLGETLRETFQHEMKMQSELSGFNLTAAIDKAADDISPKWIKAEGYDNYSLEPR